MPVNLSATLCFASKSKNPFSITSKDGVAMGDNEPVNLGRSRDLEIL
jgi:hypothetical protein